MTQTPALIQGLKAALRSGGITYSQVAKQLNMSEANIKRMFSEKRFYLDTFDKICEIAGLDILELAKQVSANKQLIEQLTESQEMELVKDQKQFFITYLVVHGLPIREIQNKYKIEYPDIVTALTHLDRLGILELHPNDRIKLLISPNFSWRNNGPIQKYFVNKLQGDFLNYSFSDEDEAFTFLSGISSKRLREKFVGKLRRLSQDFNNDIQIESGQAFENRQVTGMMLAIRTWKPNEFKEYERDDK